MIEQDVMSPTAAELIRDDQQHLIHPLHHPVDNANTIIYVRGRGATVWDIDGHEYLDGLSGLWNTNVGHGRAELADAAAAQMKELAYFSGYVGASNIPAITLANRLIEIRVRQHAGGLLHHRAAPSRTRRHSRPRAFTGRREASPTRSRSSPAFRDTTG